MSEEENKAIELAKNFTKIDFTTPNGWTGYYDRELNEISKAINILLNIITKYKKENEEKDKQIDLMADTLQDNLYLTPLDGLNKEEIKQYFEKLSKEKEGVKDE